MELAQTLMIIDQVVFTKTGRHLTDLEQAILQGTIADETYAQMAKKSHCSEGHLRYVAASLWQIISEQLGEDIKKSNFTATLKRWKIHDLYHINYHQNDTITNDFTASNHQLSTIDIQQINQQLTIEQLKHLIRETVKETIEQIIIDTPKSSTSLKSRGSESIINKILA